MNQTAPERRGLAALLLIAVLALGSGYGTHEPWPPDAPRFAVVARDMLVSGDWLFPRVGGDLYPDKPPVIFWFLAAAFWLTGSIRAGFLLPSLLASLGVVLLVHDLARRLWDRRTALLTALLLISTLQFNLQAHKGDIDAVLCFWETLGLYGLLRHLLLGPAWRWYALGGAACGIGVITKGVGFLPFLVLIPWAVMLRRRWLVGPGGTPWRWVLAPAVAVGVVLLWLVPMVAVSLGNPDLASYRDEILFGQTIDRYVDATGHRKPPWYFITGVIPWAWFPVSLALPWLAVHWRRAMRDRQSRVVLPLAWVVLVLLFFSFSSGKRALYVLPALPQVCLATGPFLRSLAETRWLNRIATGLMLAIGAFCATLASAGFGVLPATLPPIPAAVRITFGLLALLALGWSFLGPHRRRGFVRLTGFSMSAWLALGWSLPPAIDEERSGARIMRAAYAAVPEGAELAVTHHDESQLLHARGPLTNFGHRRKDEDQEAADAARWLTAGSGTRRLIVPEEDLDPCFAVGEPVNLGRAHGQPWYLVSPASVRDECAKRGSLRAAIPYVAPDSLPSMWRWIK